MNRTDLAHQITATLGDRPEDFDIDAIIDDLIDAHGPISSITSIDDIDPDTYWATIEKHDTTTV